MKSGDLKPGGNIGVPEKAWLELFIQVLPGFDEKMLYDESSSFLNEAVKMKET